MWLKKHFGRPKASLDQLGRLETEVMQRAWARKEISVRDLHAEMAGRLAYTTLMTTMDRLHKKGLLKRRKDGKAYIYSAAMSEREYQESLTQHLFGIMLGDRQNSNAVLSHFVDAVSKSDAKMLNELEEIVKAKRRLLRRSE